MKTFNFFKVLFSAVLFISLFASCSENQTFLGEDEPTFTSSSLSNARGTCYITPSVASGAFCGAPSYGNQYTLSVSGGRCTKDYDRRVTVIIYHDNNLIEQKTVTIPANQVMSNAVGIFANAPESYGVVRLQVTSVLDDNNQPDNSCIWREVSPTVNNCYSSGGNGGGDGDHCNGQDSDGDGICDYAEMPGLQ